MIYTINTAKARNLEDTIQVENSPHLNMLGLSSRYFF